MFSTTDNIVFLGTDWMVMVSATFLVTSALTLYDETERRSVTSSRHFTFRGVPSSYCEWTGKESVLFEAPSSMLSAVAPSVGISGGGW